MPRIDGQTTLTFDIKVTPPSPPHTLWRVRHDPEIARLQFTYTGHGQYWHPDEGWDWRAGYPEVYYLLGTHSVPFDERWQRLSFAMNPQMQPLKWREVYDDWRAFMNGTGFPHPNVPGTPGYDPTYQPKPRRDYVNQIDMTSLLLPAWDKIRVCGGATISGVRDGSTVIVDTLKYDNPPTLEWLMLRPWYYFAAVSILNVNGTPVIDPFPQNGTYPTWIPLVAISEVRIPYGAVEEVSEVVNPLKVY